jgi:hypothetical protein
VSVCVCVWGGGYGCVRLKYYKVNYTSTGYGGPYGCERLRLSHFQTFGSQMHAKLSAIRAGRFLPQEDLWYSFLLEAESSPGP